MYQSSDKNRRSLKLIRKELVSFALFINELLG